MKWPYLLIFFIVINFAVAEIEISEVLADPEGKDNAQRPGGEWVELYNNGEDTVFLGDFVLYDSKDDHELYVTDVNTDKLELCSYCYTIVYRNSDSDFDLSRIKDEVRLYDGYPLSEHELLDRVSFSGTEEGTSWSKVDGVWYKTKPTPGQENIYEESCDWGLDVDLEEPISKSEEFSFSLVVERNYGGKQNVTVSGELKNIFNEVIKEYKPWTSKQITNSNKKDYSPNLPEGTYILEFWLDDLNCKDLDKDNNVITKLFVINPNYEKEESYLNVDKIYLGQDDQAAWGDQLRVKTNIYKGKESRYTAELWAESDGEKISKTTKLNIYENYQNYNLTLPLQLEPDCESDEKEAKVVLEAFGLRSELPFKIEGANKEFCQEEKKVKKGWELLESDKMVTSGEPVTLKLQLPVEDEKHIYRLWSYLYRGNKCYSCDENKLERDHNMVNIKVKENEEKTVELTLFTDSDLAEGEYKIKTKMLKDEQKTTKEITTEILVKEEIQKLEEPVDTFVANEKKESPLNKRTTSKPQIVIYESSSKRAARSTAYFLILSLALTIVVLIRRNT